MSSLVILLLQQQPRMSIFVIVAAALAFAVGLALVIYFYRRFKEAEKQAPQEDWQAGMHALFVERPGGTSQTAASGTQLDDDFDQPAKAVRRKVPVGTPSIATPPTTAPASEFVDDDLDQPGKAVPRRVPPAPPAATPITAQGGQFDDLDFDQPGKAVPRQRPAVESSPDALIFGSEPPGSTQLFAAEIQTQTASDAIRESAKDSEADVASTQILSSLRARQAEEPSRSQPENEAAPAVEHRVTQQEASKQPPLVEHPVPQPPIPATPPPADMTSGSSDASQTRKLASSDLSAEVRAPRATSLFGTTDPSKGKEPLRESYEPPTVTPIKRREAYEPPTIQPLEPREGLPVTGANVIQPAGMKPTRVEVTPPPVMTSKVPSKVEDREVARSGVASQMGGVVPAASKPGQERVPAGSILGLPATASKAPLRYGVPSRPTAETGIDSLVHYGRPADAGGGRAGTVVLAALLVLMAAVVALYMFVPALNSKVNNWLSEVRSVGPEGTLPPQVDPPHANIFPSRRPEVLNNTVKARGAIDNISTPPQTLENLSLEITLGRPGGATETLRIPINPSSLEPGQRGTYEFEYDKSMGFREYRIVKLWSGDTELRYSSPAKDQGVGPTTAAAPPASQ
jgi:hypothetical protein